MHTNKAIDAFMNSRNAKNLSTYTLRWYKGILNKFNNQFQKLPRDPVKIETFLCNCQAGDERRHGYYRTLRCFYRFLKRRYKIQNPMTLIEAPRCKKKEPHFLNPQELARLLNYQHEPKIKAAIKFLIDSGARVGELANLVIDDLTETPWGYVAKIEGKTGARIVPISYETYHTLIVNLPLKYSVNVLRRKIAKAFRDAGVKGTAHTLRHTFGTLWEGDELVLQRIMGHSHLETTRIYRQIRTRILSLQHRLYSPLRMILSPTESMI